MAKISATILTYNEEQRIGACLESLRGIADEIIVVDSFSTDHTVDICRSYGARITQRRLAGYGAQRQYATSLTNHDYVLAIDADEALSPALGQSLLKLKREGFSHRVYTISRLNFYCGRPVRRCGWYPDRQIRLFDKRYANWNLRDVDESVIFRDSVRPELIDGDILHYRCSSPDEYVSTEMNHAKIAGHVLAAGNSSLSPAVALFNATKAFIRCYLGEGGCFEGATGRAISRQEYRSVKASYATARSLRNAGNDTTPSTPIEK